jgi:GNAT superfamily N-acetyltransferase
MALSWHRDLPVWDADKERIVGKAPTGSLDSRYSEMTIGSPVPCTWYRVEDDGKTVGYGWIDVVWGDAEILLAVDPAAEGKGVGTFILDRLDDEARRMGLNYIYNLVRPTHPKGDQVSAWLVERGFEHKPDGRLLRRVGAPTTA